MEMEVKQLVREPEGTDFLKETFRSKPDTGIMLYLFTMNTCCK